MDTQQIQAQIEAGIPDAQVRVTGGEGKYEATVISEAFAELSAVQRHQLVYRTVQAHIESGSLHALSIRPLTPDEQAQSNPPATSG